MKVAYLLGTLNPGGAEKLALSVMSNAKNHELDLICIYRHPGKLFKDFCDTGVKMFRLTPKGKWDLLAILRLRRLLRKESVGAIHVHQVGDAQFAIIATLFSKIKVVYTLHGISYNKHGLINGIMFGLKHSSENIFVSECQKRFYITDYQLDDGIVAKSIVLYNGIDFSPFRKRFVSDAKNDEKLIMGSVGSFVSGRNQMFICEFLEKLDSSGIDFDFSFIGGKSASESFLYDRCVDYCERNGLAEKVHFLGTRNDVPSLLEKMDAFIYASVDDTFGIAVVEAIASGVPVFVNDWDVMNEITEGGKLATIYRTKDVDDLFSHFMDFLNNRDRYIADSQDNAFSVRKMYGIDTHIEALKDIYNKII